MTADGEMPADRPTAGPRRSARGQKKAEEKYARQAEALRANLRRRQQQRRGQADDTQDNGKSDTE